MPTYHYTIQRDLTDLRELRQSVLHIPVSNKEARKIAKDGEMSEMDFHVGENLITHQQFNDFLKRHVSDACFESCAVINMLASFRELLKNSIDAILLEDKKNLLEINIQIISDNTYVSLQFTDNGPGFKNIHSTISWSCSPLAQKKESDKSSQYLFGGMGLGLKQLGNNMNSTEHNGECLLAKGSPNEGGGACIILKSNINPYTTPEMQKYLTASSDAPLQLSFLSKSTLLQKRKLKKRKLDMADSTLNIEPSKKAEGNPGTIQTQAVDLPSL